MLHIHTSNRLENLIPAFAAVIENEPLPPLMRETIVVQSQGMARWLSMSLAEHLGIWANGTFPFPYAMVWRAFRETLGHLPDTSPYEPEVMVWSLIEILPLMMEEKAFTELSGYLQEDEQDIKLFQLAWRLANIFDQYMVYRPSWLTDWENGKQPPELKHDYQARWQAILWQELVARYGSEHRANLRTAFLKNINRITKNPRFRRISVFGISALPPFHLDVLAALGQITEIHIFLLNPCQEYWGDIVSDTDIARKTKSTPSETLYFEKGNALLASMGKMGRDFIDMFNDFPHQSHEYFEEPGETTLLTCIQSDILQLRESNPDQPIPIDSDDKSIQIHACHSPMREVEVLHDQLLALFEAHPNLLPKDVLVMMPDIEVYAPFIEAVFDTTPDQAKRIPFSLADRSLRGQSVLINTFFAILELSNSRLSVTQVLAVLETEAVQKRFQLNEQDLDLIRYWIEKTGIRWGMNAADRERMNLPAYEENTWDAGLKRLLLGYALLKSPVIEGKEERGKEKVERGKEKEEKHQAVEMVGGEYLFQGILPYDEFEGNESLILGKLAEFIERLFQCIQDLEQSRTLPEWASFLTSILERFFSTDEESETDAQTIRNVLNQLAEQEDKPKFNQPVNREVILAYLRHNLEEEPQPTHFLTGKVSFCTMRPMRSIPFKVICLLGMNDQAYPRPSKSLGFDLIAKHPKPGDRSRRQNDRYLFLESLLSARDYFYISYVGHSIHDNTVMPPSVLVSELLDYMGKGFVSPHQNLLDNLVIHHPLQAFSPRYFNETDQHLFSFSDEYCSASSVLLNERQRAKDFIAESLPPPQPEANWKTLDINRLARFFKNPTEFLLTQRLGIKLHSEANLLDESEPFEVRGLERYTLNQTLVEKSLEGVDLYDYHKIAKASGQLPHGGIGDYAYSQLVGQIQPFVERVQQATTRQKKREAALVNLTIDDMRMTGYLGRLWRDNLVHYRCAKVKATDFIQLWIHHLVLNSLPDQKLPRHSLLIGEDGSWEFKPVDQSVAILATLLKDYYWQGLMQPLYFFPQSSLAFVEQLIAGKSEEEAFSRAQNTWRGSDFATGEADNDYYQLCFGKTGETTPLDNEPFKMLAKQFFEPMLAHLQSIDN
jgi:exodeoxyribonuclease V gamma subunit